MLRHSTGELTPELHANNYLCSEEASTLYNQEIIFDPISTAIYTYSSLYSTGIHDAI